MRGAVERGGVVKLKLLAAALAIAITGHSTMAHAWPRFTGGNSSECQQAFELAKATFQSDRYLIVPPPEMPETFGSKISVNLTRYPVTFDAERFEMLPREAIPVAREVYWQINPQLGQRFALFQRSGNGSRGDEYALYSADENVSRDVLVADFPGVFRSTIFRPIVEGSFVPPLILTDKVSNSSWAIVQNTDNSKLGSWDVWTTEADGTRQRCSISFEPKVRRAVFLMPAAVQQFAAMLDEVLGPDPPLESLHPNSIIRIHTNLLWGNVALRPWALNEIPYNSRDRVEEGLRIWSAWTAKTSALYASVLRQYPVAEAALAEYYRDTFNMPDEDAHKMASYATDIMFRSYFVFHGGYSEGYSRRNQSEPGLNPWKQLRHG